MMKIRLGSTRCLGAASLLIAGASFSISSAQAQVMSQPRSSDPVAKRILKDIPVMPLPDQKYALCAGAITFNFDGVTYARCTYLDGDSVSAKQSYKGGNVQTVNNIGNAPANQSFVVSTFSPPSPSEFAAYSCKQQGAYAQCDGGICFSSTIGKEFPGLGKLTNNQIVCSCPIKESTNYHVWGPASCPTSKAQYDSICAKGSDRQTAKNGVSLRIGNNGPVAVTKALVDYYDLVYKTSNGLKTCERP
jgi:hypothetical protein